MLTQKNVFVRTHALNAIDNIDVESKKVITALTTLEKNYPAGNDPMRYDDRMVQWLFTKWGISNTTQ